MWLTTSETSQVSEDGPFWTKSSRFYEITDIVATKQVDAQTFLWRIFYDSMNSQTWFFDSLSGINAYLKQYNGIWYNSLSRTQKDNSHDDIKIVFHLFGIL